MTEPSRLSIAIARRCMAEGIYIEKPEEMYLERTHAGYWQRAQGAWSWELLGPGDHAPMIGSQWPAREVLAWEDWEADGGAIYPGPIAGARLADRTTSPSTDTDRSPE